MSWSTAKFGELCTLFNGKAYKATDWDTQGLPIIRIQNLNDHGKPFNYWSGSLDKQVLVQNNDVLLAWSGTPGTSFGAHIWNRGNAVLNQHIFRVDLDSKKVLKKWAVLSVNRQLKILIDQAHGGVGLKHVTKRMVENLDIPITPISEQERICAILDKADAIRRKREQAIKLADEFLRSVFLDMFGNPVTNPKGWEIGTIRDIVSEVKYGTSKKAHGTDGNFPILRMNNITYQGKLDLTDLKYIDLDHKDEKKYIAQKGDILFNRTNSKKLVGKTAVYNLDTPMALAGYLIRIRCNNKSNPYYISAYLNSKHGKATLLGMCKSIVGMANINAQELQDIKIHIPPVVEQNRYADLLLSVHKKTQKYNNSLNESTFLFFSLTQRAFRGEL